MESRGCELTVMLAAVHGVILTPSVARDLFPLFGLDQHGLHRGIISQHLCVVETLKEGMCLAFFQMPLV